MLSSHHIILGTVPESWGVHHGASACRNPSKYWLCVIRICIWYIYIYLQPPGVMNVDVDEHPLELVEQLEWRDQAPGDPGNPFLRETTPFDWDIQGRGHPLRFPKDPYGTEAHWRIGGSMTQDQGISQPKDDRIFQNKNLNPNNAKLDPTTNSYQCQSQQSYSAHSLRMSCLKEFFPDRRRH